METVGAILAGYAELLLIGIIAAGLVWLVMVLNGAATGQGRKRK